MRIGIKQLLLVLLFWQGVLPAQSIVLFPADPLDLQEEVQEDHLCRWGVNRSYKLIRDALQRRKLDLQVADLEAYNKPFSALEKALNFFGKPPFVEEPGALRYVVWSWYMSRAQQEQVFARLPKEKAILFLWEPPSTSPHLYKKKFHELFSKIYTWDDDLVDNKKYFKFYYPVFAKRIDSIPSFEKKKLLVLIASNKGSQHPHELYSERRRVIDFFEARSSGDFDFYGKGWSDSYKNYRGEIAIKHEVLKNYRFSICYENIDHIKGYITEKIFDCFRAGVVPIYLGASNIADYIPKECFIAREKFGSDEELYAFLRAMPKEEYESYLAAIDRFLESKAATLFTAEHFEATFFQALNL